jgi:hypothetical protein
MGWFAVACLLGLTATVTAGGRAAASSAAEVNGGLESPPDRRAASAAADGTGECAAPCSSASCIPSVPGMLTQGGHPVPLASRLHRILTHFLLALHWI